MTGKNIDALSIFGDYKQLENRVTTAFLHLVKAGGEDLIRFILSKIDKEIPSNEIIYSTQDSLEASVPDGTIECSFKFKIYFESKLTLNSINIDQLNNHYDLIKGEEEHLLFYITPDVKKPKILYEDVLWANWMQIRDWIKDYIDNNNINPGDLLYYLYENFELLITNSGLISELWDSSVNERVVIFAGGKYGEETALRFNLYFCQLNRNIKPSGYISFYRDWRIKYCFKIDKPPEIGNLLEYDGLEEYFKDKGILGKEKYEWINEPQQIFKLGKKCEINELKNDLKTENGIPRPYTYGGQRYTTIDRLRNAKWTSELKD